MALSRRMGTFSVPLAALADGLGSGANIFHNMVVLHAEHDFASDKILYVAIHPDFEESPEGNLLPVYVGQVSPDSIHPTWKKL